MNVHEARKSQQISPPDPAKTHTKAKQTPDGTQTIVGINNRSAPSSPRSSAVSGEEHGSDVRPPAGSDSTGATDQSCVTPKRPLNSLSPASSQ